MDSSNISGLGDLSLLNVEFASGSPNGITRAGGLIYGDDPVWHHLEKKQLGFSAASRRPAWFESIVRFLR